MQVYPSQENRKRPDDRITTSRIPLPTRTVSILAAVKPNGSPRPGQPTDKRTMSSAPQPSRTRNRQSRNANLKPNQSPPRTCTSETQVVRFSCKVKLAATTQDYRRQPALRCAAPRSCVPGIISESRVVESAQGVCWCLQVWGGAASRACEWAAKQGWCGVPSCAPLNGVQGEGGREGRRPARCIGLAS